MICQIKKCSVDISMKLSGGGCSDLACSDMTASRFPSQRQGRSCWALEPRLLCRGHIEYQPRAHAVCLYRRPRSAVQQPVSMALTRPGVGGLIPIAATLAAL